MQKPFSRVALFGRFQTAAIGSSVRDIADFLATRDISVLLDQSTAESIGAGPWQGADTERIGQEADLAIAVGGDGTMLGVARILAPFGIPVVGINHGRLGFITDIALAGWRPALAAILEGHFESEERTLLTSRVLRDQQTVWQELSLNDVVVSRSSRSGMIELQVKVDGLYMHTQRGDGLIIATPTGSTAYALSANGPILHPLLRGLVLVPVAPQTLSNRPICLPDQASIVVRVVDGREPRVACDMQVFTDLQVGDDIVIERAPFTTRFLHPPGYSYFATLRGKLNWQELPSSLQPAGEGH
jgi:NAD+ kinase